MKRFFSKKDGVKVEFIRVTYDIEKTAKAIEESELPNVYALMFRKAYKCTVVKSFLENFKLF